MSQFRFYRCEEVRCPRYGEQLNFLKATKHESLTLEHPRADCPYAGKKFCAAPLVVELEEVK